MNNFILTLTFDPAAGSKCSEKCCTCHSRLRQHNNVHPSLVSIRICPICFSLKPDLSAPTAAGRPKLPPSDADEAAPLQVPAPAAGPDGPPKKKPSNPSAILLPAKPKPPEDKS